jgi:hypothetical protein
MFMHRVCIIVHCVLVTAPTTITEITFLLYYLFQENKSFGSKKPFAFILWCTRSCVEHMYNPKMQTSFIKIVAPEKNINEKDV